jgi:hypothetical protein
VPDPGPVWVGESVRLFIARPSRSFATLEGGAAVCSSITVRKNTSVEYTLRQRRVYGSLGMISRPGTQLRGRYLKLDKALE